MDRLITEEELVEDSFEKNISLFMLLFNVTTKCTICGD